MKVQLSFQMQRQMQTNWAWAAVAASISNYYNVLNPMTQCSLANWAFRQTTCCMQGNSSACNQPMSLKESLAHCGVLNSAYANALSFPDIKAQLDAHLPVCVIVRWQQGTIGHPVVITGYDDNNQGSPIISLSDPWYGESIVDFGRFPANYHGGGSWTYTYTTKQQ